MSEDLTTKPMFEAILEGQRHIVAQLVDLRKGYDSLAAKVDQLEAKVDQLEAKVDQLEAKVDQLDAKVDQLAIKVDQIAAKQDELAAKQDDLAARQDRLELRMAELSREVRDGLYNTNRAIEVFNKRMLDFEVWLRRVDERLHDEILLRTK